MNDSGVNVVTIQDIDYDKLLGPLPTVAHVMDTMVMISLRCSEVRSVVQQLKVAPKKNEIEPIGALSGSRYFHWLFYIQSARNESEQNLEVVTKHGQLYYRTTRDIKEGEELLVWYSKELIDAFQVPDVTEFYDKVERRYICHYCHDTFVYPNPLKVHLMYRCHRRLAEVHGFNKVQLDSINRLQLDLYSATMMHQPVKPTSFTTNNISNNYKLNSAFTFTSLTNNFLDIYRRVTPMAAVAAAAAAAATNLGIEKENSNSVTSQSSLTTTNTTLLPIFQGSDYGLVMNDNSPCLKRSLDHTQPPPGGGSAFKKVNKSNSSNIYQSDPGKQSLYPITSYSRPIAPTESPPAASVASLSSPSTPASCWGGLIVNTSSTQESTPSPTPTSSILNGVTSPYATVSPTPNLNFNTAVNGAEDTAAMLTVSYRNAVYTDSIMTSDLVYHMRSHHKRDPDPMKKKREDKLRCHICNETFRERHHLTRHMTSHN
ncbi:PR domain containing 8 [Chamberlinius hualienensis]